MVARDSGAVKTRPLPHSSLGFAIWPCLLRLLLLLAAPSGKVFSGGAMAANRQQVVCTQCEKTEEYCTCEKYCTICKGQSNVRLGVDGLYYCPDCREACDVALANER
jgi:hypothetical protein